MTEWQVVGVVVALIGLVTALVTPMLKLNTSITTLTVVVEKNSQALERHEKHSREAHARLHARVDEVEEKVDGHEARITKLETKSEMKS